MSSEDLLQRASAWSGKGGTPAGNYVTEGLNHYLDPDSAEPDQLTRRLQWFEGQVTAMVDAAQPLVGIKKSVLVAVHGRTDVSSSTFFTEFPFSPNSPAAEIVQRVLESKGIWSSEIAELYRE